jgi:type VI secretion system protein ImpA
MPASEEIILTPVTPEDPCGPNLEYDSAFAALERARQPKPEQQMGATIVPAQEPDWKDVGRQAAAFLLRSKDLRAACGMAQALLRTNGLSGFAEGLSGLRQLVERYWQGLHPRLDPEDGDDPTMRVNILVELAEPSVIAAVRNTVLVVSRAVGRFSLKDVEVASGDAPGTVGAESPTMVTIEAAVMDCELGELTENTAAARTCVESVVAIEAFVTEQVGSEHAPALGKLTAVLKKIASFLGTGLTRRQPVAAEVEPGSVAGGGNGVPGGAVRPLTGEIASREDVQRALDKICRYYEKHEPSSPIPILLQRCQRLVSSSFIDIVRDLVPEAVSTVELLQGRPKE